jgi:hypothetical protein
VPQLPMRSPAFGLSLKSMTMVYMGMCLIHQFAHRTSYVANIPSTARHLSLLDLTLHKSDFVPSALSGG